MSKVKLDILSEWVKYIRFLTFCQIYKLKFYMNALAKSAFKDKKIKRQTSVGLLFMTNMLLYLQTNLLINIVFVCNYKYVVLPTDKASN